MDDRQFHATDGHRRRGATRMPQRVFGLVDYDAENTELIRELHRWVLGLPFVEELDPIASAPRMRRFAVHHVR